MKYRSLNLEAFDYKKEGETESFDSLISDSPVGRMAWSNAIRVTLPPDLRPRVRQLEKRLLSLPEMIKLGEDLAAALFPPRLRSFLDRSRERLAENEGLRIHLMLDAYELADIPWEYAYLGTKDTPPDQKKINGFLAFDRSVSLLRDPILEQPRRELAPVANQDLRMVVLLSNPLGTPELDLGTEQQIIDQAIREIQDITVQYYPRATVDLLLQATRNEAHIFHYSGHGNFELAPGGKEGEGFLQLTGVDGAECLFSATKLAITLNSRGVRLAMLGACESSRVDRVNAWTGIAPALMLAGIPAVVGMQFSILDENAILFSKAFYEGVADGQPIDEAVAAGRQAILMLANDDAERDWGAPALYLRTEGDGILFPRTAYVAGQALKATFEKLAIKAPIAVEDELPSNAPIAVEDKLPSEAPIAVDDKLPRKAPIADEEKLTVEAPIAAEDKLPSKAPNADVVVKDIGETRALFRNTFQACLDQIDVVIDYMGLNDNLHDLQFLFPMIRKEASSLRDANDIFDSAHARALRIHERELRRAIDELREILKNNKVSAREGEWVEVLDRARSDMKAAIETPEPQMHLLNAAVLKIAQVVETQPTWINGSLMRAVGALRISDLIDIVQRVFDEAIINSGNTEAVQRIQQGIEALKTLNTELSSLINEHETWAAHEPRIQMLQYLLPNLPTFEAVWHSVIAKISFLYAGSEEEWAREMKHAEEALNEACNNKDMQAVTNWFELFSDEIKHRFWNVEREILLKCKELLDIRQNMESI